MNKDDKLHGIKSNMSLEILHFFSFVLNIMLRVLTSNPCKFLDFMPQGFINSYILFGRVKEI